MPDPFQNHSKPRPASAMRHIELSSGANTLTDTCDAIYCQADGTVTITDSVGTAEAYAMVRGEVLPFRATVMNVASGTFYAWYF